MKALLALAALLTAAPSTPVATGPGTPYYDGLPPERFFHEGAAIVLFVGDVSPYCGYAPPGLTTIACTIETDKGTPVIIMPHPITLGRQGDFYARVLAHELSHQQG